MKRYRTIVADPPWTIKPGGSAPSSTWARPRPGRLPYDQMKLEEIAALPVIDWVYPDSHLYLWAPNAYLEQSYEVARCWGFKPSQVLVWAKTPRGLGLGGAFTSTTEFVLFARRGSLRPARRLDTSWWNWKRLEHSRKPDAFLDLVEQVSPGPYLELFARRARFGWDYWGDESLGTAKLPEVA